MSTKPRIVMSPYVAWPSSRFVKFFERKNEPIMMIRMSWKIIKANENIEDT